jgi:hypothetical protein
VFFGVFSPETANFRSENAQNPTSARTISALYTTFGTFFGTFRGRFKLTKRPKLYVKFRIPIQNFALAIPIVRNTSSRQRLFIAPKTCSTRHRTLDLILFIFFCSSVSGLFR